MRTLNALLLFVPLVAGFAQTADPSAPAYFTVYNVTGDSTVSQQFVVQITNPVTIQQARTQLALPESERPHVRGTVVKASSYYNAPWSFHVDPVSIGFSEVSVEVCDASTSEVEANLMQVGEAFLPDSVWCPWSSKLLAEVPAPDTAATSLRIASAASDSEAAISPGALISIYGQNLTDHTENASTTDPAVTLAGITAQIKSPMESSSRQLTLLLGSPSQVNAMIPPDMPTGPVSINITNASGQTFQAASYVESIAPALFVVSQNNLDYAAASLQRVHADGSNSFESLVETDPVSGQLTPVPLDFGSPTDELYLSLYGTGWRLQCGVCFSDARRGVDAHSFCRPPGPGCGTRSSQYPAVSIAQHPALPGTPAQRNERRRIPGKDQSGSHPHSCFNGKRGCISVPVCLPRYAICWVST